MPRIFSFVSWTKAALGLAFLLALGAAGCGGPGIDKTQWYVSLSGQDGNECHTAANACRTIQATIDRARDGDTLHIDKGTYNENLHITKPLTLTGAGMNDTIIDGQGQQTDNSVVWVDGEAYTAGTPKVTLSEMTLQNGRNLDAAVGWGGFTAGGGIYAIKTELVLDALRVANNQAVSGGGIYYAQPAGSSAYSSINITNSQIDHNSADNYGGIYSSGFLFLQKTEISDNSAKEIGGGLYVENSAQVHRVTVKGNSAQKGAGIYSNIAAPAQKRFILDDSTLDSNQGGGLLSFYADVQRSTFSNNTGSGITNLGDLMVINSTISQNLPESESQAGLVNEGSSAMVYAAYLTIAENKGHGIVQNGGTFDLYNSIVADNVGNCLIDNSASLGGKDNLATDESCGKTAIVVSDARLGPLMDNGGPTLTQSLFPGSPAIDAGQAVGNISIDQRGESRPKDGNGDGLAAYDLGAYEYDPNMVPPPTPTPTPTTTGTPNATFEAVFFSPAKDVACRFGPSNVYHILYGAKAGVVYPLLGRNNDTTWFLIAISEKQRCWVSAESGSVTGGDPGNVRVVFVPAPTRTPTPTPTRPPSE